MSTASSVPDLTASFPVPLYVLKKLGNGDVVLGVAVLRDALGGRQDRRVPPGLLTMVKPTRVTNSIRTLRFAHGEMTQAELADRIGVTRQTVIAIEQGRYSPSL